MPLLCFLMTIHHSISACDNSFNSELIICLSVNKRAPHCHKVQGHTDFLFRGNNWIDS